MKSMELNRSSIMITTLWEKPEAENIVGMYNFFVLLHIDKLNN